MRFLPVWSKLEAVAHTLPYDATILRGTQDGHPLPAERWSSVTMPTLVIVGGKSPTWFHTSTQTLAQVLPNAQHQVLEGQTHNVKAKPLAAMLEQFFTR
jgi:pimeloyl-ACP methyl ester carboxylesterase